MKILFGNITMKTYTYKQGSKIEVEHISAVDVVFAMGECHVGEVSANVYHATATNGESQACDTWHEAKNFLFENQ